MTIIELTLDPADQSKYGGPEWATLDILGLDYIPFDVLDPLEHQIKELWGIGIPRLLAEEMPEDTMRARRALVWLARRIAGTETPDLAEFHINARRMRFRVVKPSGDQGPPAAASSTTSSEEKTSAKASSRSSRGSGKTPATSSRRAKSGS